jgi:hypothetical protein
MMTIDVPDGLGILGNKLLNNYNLHMHNAIHAYMLIGICSRIQLFMVLFSEQMPNRHDKRK